MSITEALSPSFPPLVKLSEQLSDQPSWRTGIHRPVCCSPQKEEACDCETRDRKLTQEVLCPGTDAHGLTTSGLNKEVMEQYQENQAL